MMCATMQPVSQQPTITVHSSAEVSTPPDRASLWWSASVQTKSAEEAKSAIAQRLAMVDSALVSHESAIVQTNRKLHVGPRLRVQRGKSVRDGYTGQCTVHVQLHDFTTLAELVGDLLSVPDSALSGPDWSLEPSNPAFSEARLSAIREAQRIAIDYAAAFGATLAALEEVIDDAGHPMMARTMMRASSPGGEDFELQLAPEPQLAQAGVSVKFSISKPTVEALSGAI